MMPVDARARVVTKRRAAALLTDETWDQYVRRNGGEPATIAMLGDLVTVLIDPLIERNARIAELETRIKALEARPALMYAGVHVPGTLYPEGRLVTRAGSLWLSTVDTTSTPPSTEWRLVVKKGGA